MGENGREARYKLVTLDESGLVYLGVNVTNGKEAALFYIDDADLIKIEGSTEDDFNFWKAVQQFSMFMGIEDGEIDGHVTIEGHKYWARAWSKSFDRAMVNLIDRLISARMKNSQVVGLTLQLEMPL